MQRYCQCKNLKESNTYDILWYAKLTQGQTTVPHHGLLISVRAHASK